MRLTILKMFSVFLIVAVGLAVLSSIFLWQWLNAERQLQESERVFVVARGSSLFSVATQLEEQSIIVYGDLWVAYARISGQSKIKAGEYAFSERETPRSVLNKLNRGAVTQYQVTLVEGVRFKDFLSHIHSQEKIEKTFDYTDALSILVDAGVAVEHLEGWFYPDTYQYTAGDTDVSILLRAYHEMRRVLDEEWLTRAQDLPFSTPYDALILASIVEKETGVPYERPEIAGVFVRRLQKGMRLQTDPTVIYGMGENFDGNIRRRDLRTPTPYNTYVIDGLPPTPIAMPGRAAIHAALNPLEGSSLFFVAKGDGSHHFSDTLDEHVNAVRRYQKSRRPDYRSSPVLPPEKRHER